MVYGVLSTVMPTSSNVQQTADFHLYLEYDIKTHERLIMGLLQAAFFNRLTFRVLISNDQGGRSCIQTIYTVYYHGLYIILYVMMMPERKNMAKPFLCITLARDLLFLTGS